MSRSSIVAAVVLTYSCTAMGQQISREALEACAKSGVAECQFKWGEVREAAGAAAGARALYEKAYAGKHEPAGQALLRMVRGATASDQGSSPPLQATAQLKGDPAQVASASARQQAVAPPAAIRQQELSAQPVAGRFIGAPSKDIHTCWEATFTQQIRGELVARPDWRPGVFREVGAEPTSQVFVFCFSPYGTPGSGMYAGKTFIQLRQLDDRGVLAGTYTNPDKTLTNFHYVNSTENKEPGYAMNRPDLPKGTAVLQVTPNIKKFAPGLPMFELRGTSKRVPVPAK